MLLLLERHVAIMASTNEDFYKQLTSIKTLWGEVYLVEHILLTERLHIICNYDHKVAKNHFSNAGCKGQSRQARLNLQQNCKH